MYPQKQCLASSLSSSINLITSRFSTSVSAPSNHLCLKTTIIRGVILLIMVDIEVVVYTGEGEASISHDVVRVGSIPPSRRSLKRHFSGARSWPRWSCVKASWKLGNVPLGVANTQLRRSSSPHHSGGSVIGPFIALFELQFIFTMALKALEELHSLTASSPTSESRPSSQ